MPEHLEPELQLPRETPIRQVLKETIRAKGPITFAEFMEISLYHPAGLYSSGRLQIDGRDFATWPEVTPAFSYSLGNMVHGQWQQMGSPSDFDLVEIGGGNGTMACEMLDKLHRSFPDLYKTLHSYTIVEISPELAERQRKRAREAGHDDKITVINESALTVPLTDVNGIVIMNEALDAIPPHRLIGRDGKTKEIYTGLDDAGNFIDIEDWPSEQIDDPAYFTHIYEGIQKPVCPSIRPLMENIGRMMRRGLVVTIDYGTCDEELGRLSTAFGTFYQGSRSLQAAFDHPGEVDITAEVNFSLVQEMGMRYGLMPYDFMGQNQLLIDNGVLEEIVDLYTPDEYADLLTHFDNDKTYFKVLLQQKNM